MDRLKLKSKNEDKITWKRVPSMMPVNKSKIEASKHSCWEEDSAYMLYLILHLPQTLGDNVCVNSKIWANICLPLSREQVWVQLLETARECSRCLLRQNRVEKVHGKVWGRHQPLIAGLTGSSCLRFLPGRPTLRLLRGLAGVPSSGLSWSAPSSLCTVIEGQNHNTEPNHIRA